MFDEYGNADCSAGRLTGVHDGLPESYEVVLLDSGSREVIRTDTCDAPRERAGSGHLVCGREVIRTDTCDAPAKCLGLLGLRLSRSFGHQAALTVELKNACARAMVSVNGDVQQPLEAVPQSLEARGPAASLFPPPTLIRQS